MSGVYKMVEVVGTSPTSFAEAVRSGVEEAGKTVHHMAWFEVVDMRGALKDGRVAEFQVTMKIGFKVER
jgi:flavin-binding protein dodecin